MHAQYHGFRKWALENEGKPVFSSQLEDVGLYYKVICVIVICVIDTERHNEKHDN